MIDKNSLVLGFDLDNVLRTLSLPTIHICEIIKDYSPFEVDSLSATRPLLNPMDLALPEDQLYVLTRCYTDVDIRRKQEWLNHYYGNRIEMFTVPKCTENWGTEYYEQVGKAKYDIIKELESDMYFDDDPGLIRVMRRLAKKDNFHCKFIKYGCWIEQYTPKEDINKNGN